MKKIISNANEMRKANPLKLLEWSNHKRSIIKNIQKSYIFQKESAKIVDIFCKKLLKHTKCKVVKNI